MKKLLSLIVSAALGISLCACGGGGGTATTAAPAQNSGQTQAAAAPAAPSGETYKFSVANIYAAVNNHGVLAQKWCDAITERTGGRVQFDFYPGASLVADNGSFDAIKNGIADIAMFSTASTPGVFPAMSLLEVPQGYDSGWVGTKVANEFIQNYDLQEFKDIHPLYIHTTSPLVILGNKEVKSAADFKGMVIRSGSDLATKTTTALGGQAYSCQITELFEALSKNMCDAAITGIDTLAGFNLAEAVKYCYPDPSYGKVGVVLTAMNKQKWDSLPDDIKKVFTETSAEFADQQGMCWVYEDATSLEAFKENNGGQVIYFDDATKAELKSILEPVNEEFAKNTGLSQETIDEYKGWLAEKIAEYNAKKPSHEEAEAWGKENLGQK